MNKAILFSDLHCSNKQLKNLYELIIKNKKDISCLIFAGDVVNTGEPVWFMEAFIKAIDKIELPFFWVPGNNDFGRAYYKLNAKYKSLEGRIATLPKAVIPDPIGNPEKMELDPRVKPEDDNGRGLGKDGSIHFTGVGGSPASWAGQYAGENMVKQKDIVGSIFVSHYPPPGILTLQPKDLPVFASRHSELVSESQKIPDRVRDDKSGGRRFANAPLVHICGHLHYRFGTALLGRTKVIQLASLETGHYAMMDLETLAVEFKKFRMNKKFNIKEIE